MAAIKNNNAKPVTENNRLSAHQKDRKDDKPDDKTIKDLQTIIDGNAAGVGSRCNLNLKSDSPTNEPQSLIDGTVAETKTRTAQAVAAIGDVGA